MDRPRRDALALVAKYGLVVVEEIMGTKHRRLWLARRDDAGRTPIGHITISNSSVDKSHKLICMDRDLRRMRAASGGLPWTKENPASLSVRGQSHIGGGRNCPHNRLGQA